VPGTGDWYARNIYIEGHPQYAEHFSKYGHPSKSGFKDTIPLWKAERFDPDRLMRLFKRAGARYFVSMGVHHDNFDLWTSKHHRWNAVNMGPRRDIVASWQGAARRQGLRFGVSEHLAPSYSWFQTSHGADSKGPLAGVPYDGGRPALRRPLSRQPHPVTDARSWYAGSAAWKLQWFRRIKDLVDTHRPDLLYTDGGIPFGDVGRSLVAHLYNESLTRHGGRLEAVYTCKDWAPASTATAAASRISNGRACTGSTYAPGRPIPPSATGLQRTVEVRPGRRHPFLRRHRQHERQPPAQHRSAPRGDLDPEAEVSSSRWHAGSRSTAKRCLRRGRG
jgi:alpha-L-fucosidase